MADDPVIVEGLIDVPQAEVGLLLESGHLYLEMQKFKEAEEIFAGVAALVPHSEVPLICLGNTALSRGQFERALRFHKDAVSRAPDSALALAHRGEALLFLKKKKEAKADLDKAVAMDPDGPAGAFANSLLDAIAAEVM